LQGSASLHDKELVLTVVNPHVSATRETRIGVRGASLKSGSATTVTNSDIHAHNTFAERNTVSPQIKALDFRGAVLSYSFPPASATKLTLSLE
jgi:alpha-L-arabinofuranosidase